MFKVAILSLRAAQAVVTVAELGLAAYGTFAVAA
jgi:hypothetical protein